MCILVASTLHPDYALILLSNRDEYLKRPTSRAKFWDPPHSHILAPFDLARPEHGTWIGINKKGRLAVLLNLHETSVKNLKGAISRGLFPKEFLQSDLETSEWIAKENSKYAEEELALSGGFTMFCGVLKRNKASVSRTSDEFPGIEPFQLLTNRGKTLGVKIFDMNSTAEVDGKDTPSINGKTIAISNTPVTEPWPKVGLGIKALESVITKAVENNASEPELIESLIQVINNDTYPVSDDRKQAFENLRHSVFIPPQPVNLPAATKSTNGIKEEVTATPPIDKPCSDKPQEVAEDITTGVYYGTRTNTIILVSKTGHVKYIERSLHTSDTPVEEDGIQESVFEFEIEDF